MFLVFVLWNGWMSYVNFKDGHPIAIFSLICTFIASVCCIDAGKKWKKQK
jgi:hypothetical protein